MRLLVHSSLERVVVMVVVVVVVVAVVGAGVGGSFKIGRPRQRDWKKFGRRWTVGWGS